MFFSKKQNSVQIQKKVDERFEIAKETLDNSLHEDSNILTFFELSIKQSDGNHTKD